MGPRFLLPPHAWSSGCLASAPHIASRLRLQILHLFHSCSHLRHMPISKTLSLRNNGNWKKELVEVLLVRKGEDVNIHCLKCISFYIQGE